MKKEKDDLNWLNFIEEDIDSDNDIDFSSNESDLEIVNEESEEDEVETEDEDVDVTDTEEDFDEEDSYENEVETDEDSTFSPFVEELYNEGVLDFDENEEYDDDIEGFAKIVEYTVSKKVNDKLDSIPPTLREAIRIAEEGGDWLEIVEASAEVDYSHVDMDDEDNYSILIEEYLQDQELDSDEIEEMIQSYRDSNTLQKQAKMAQKYLIKRREQSILEATRKQEETIKARQKQAEEVQSNIKSKILSLEEIAGFEISKKEKQNLIDYIFKPVNRQGETQVQVDMKVDDTMSIKQAYLMMKKFDFSQVEKKAKTSTARDFKKILNKYSETSKKSSMPRKSQKDDLYIPED